MDKWVCKICGKEFEVRKSAIEKSNASGNYCCTECYYKSMEVERIGRYGHVYFPYEQIMRRKV